MSKLRGQESVINHSGVKVGLRMADGRERCDLAVEQLPLFSMDVLAPWRIPKSYKKQEHKPGFYCMSQTAEMVLCESRLELRILEQIDFQERVDCVLPQPMQLTFEVDGETRRHIPDFLVKRPEGMLLVNVKPLAYQGRVVNRRAFSACDALAQRLGWIHRVYGEPNDNFLTNLRWLGGYRRPPFQFNDLRPQLMDRLVHEGIRFDDWIQGVGCEALARPVAFHLLWKRQVKFDIDSPLTGNSVVSRKHHG